MKELKSEPAKAQLLETLEKLLQQAKGTQRSSTAIKSPQAAPHATPSTPAITTSAPSNPGAESADKPSAKKVPKKKATRAPSIDITLTSPPKDLDLANIDPELLLQGPAKRLSITDIPSSDSEEDEDGGAQDLEQDDADDEVRPPRRRKRGGNEPSSSDEDNDGAMDVDSSPDDVSFKNLDRLGQSVEMDMSPDNAMNERASLVPEIRTVSEDVAPAEDDSERPSTEAESSQVTCILSCATLYLSSEGRSLPRQGLRNPQATQNRTHPSTSQTALNTQQILLFSTLLRPRRPQPNLFRKYLRLAQMELQKQHTP